MCYSICSLRPDERIPGTEADRGKNGDLSGGNFIFRVCGSKIVRGIRHNKRAVGANYGL